LQQAQRLGFGDRGAPDHHGRILQVRTHLLQELQQRLGAEAFVGEDEVRALCFHQVDGAHEAIGLPADAQIFGSGEDRTQPFRRQGLCFTYSDVSDRR
jgi:hypothetical protein